MSDDLRAENHLWPPYGSALKALLTIHADGRITTEGVTDIDEDAKKVLDAMSVDLQRARAAIIYRLDAVTRERDEARARIGELETALRPFEELAASLVEGTEDYADDHSVTVVVGRSADYLSVKLGDIRRARAALNGEARNG